MSDEPRAWVFEDENGNLVLEDPDALAVMQAVEQHNREQARAHCLRMFQEQFDRVLHFRDRYAQAGYTADEHVIVIINVDDEQGNILAEALMPGHDWQPIRDQGQVPFARGIAGREGVQGFLDLLPTKTAAEQLRRLVDGIPVVVVDAGTAAVFMTH